MFASWKIVRSRYLEFVRKVTFSIWKDEPQESSFITPVGRRYRSALCIVVNTFHVPLFSLEAIMKSKIHLTCRQLLRKPPKKFQFQFSIRFVRQEPANWEFSQLSRCSIRLAQLITQADRAGNSWTKTKIPASIFQEKTSQKRKRGVNGFQWQP